ncbi:MAG TPA: DUF6599 family protein, partial [Isosphaeraceae bacterium]|nr:DUF6599 family protein [Isosphaeraceae bacterium]
GRAESFIQYDVKGMAYTFYHPLGDDSGEVQLYVFEMGSPLKALGKYGSEKNDDVSAVAVGTEGYTSAGSLFFYSGRFYIQIVSNKDDPKYAAFALELAKRVASAMAPAPATASGPAGSKPAQTAATPESIFALLPAGQGRSSPKYVAQDVFGFSFMSDVFLADYQDGGVAWQGFLRPYPTADAAREIFEKYVASARQDGAEIKMIEADGADRMFRSASFGQVDVVFLKGNAVGGANGANGGDDAGKQAEAFARKFAASLPATVPVIEDSKSAPARGGEGTGDR